MNSKLIGGILLIVGTAIGGGMLALPIGTSQIGFINSSLLLFACWSIMTASAFLVLEINLWLPRNSNIISMAKATLGKPGEIVAWITYLLLLYSLIAGYLAGGGDVLKNLLSMIGVNISSRIASITFGVVLGYIVFLGIRSVDYVNRGLMVTKFGSLILLMAFLLPHVSLINLTNGNLYHLTAGITVTITSFGFATLIPSLRAYFEDDVVMLRKAILIGSLIPLLCYICWDLAIMGVIPINGDNGLVAMLHSNRSTSELMNMISTLVQRETVTILARVFISICVATAFLGVSLGLSDFLADGFRMAKRGKNNIVIFGATFIPPLFITLMYPGFFIKAMEYAGIYCMILLALLPATMAWWGRYRCSIATGYRVFGGKPLLIILIVVSVLIILQSLV